jgi:tRNA pseudouridine38-40 synthase
MTLFDPDDVDEAPHPPLERVRMVVAYDGTSFHGFAPNPGIRTVGGSLQEALERVLRHPVDLTCAGRTDAGVHAHGQVVDLVTSVGTDLQALGRALNSLCGPDVAVRNLDVVPDTFSSRFDAMSRTYRYTIHNDHVPDPFSVRTAWHVPQALDLDRLRLGCDPFIGSHDFTSFCRRSLGPDGEERSSVREVFGARWEVAGDRTLWFWMEASSFCHQMVRSVVGTLVEVGLGRRPAGEITGMLRARDRSAAGQVAPPHGLTLWHVRYPATAAVPAPTD